MAPTTTAQWVVSSKDGFDKMKLEKDVKIPQLGEHEVLLEVDAVSLNYRDLIIPQVYRTLPNQGDPYRKLTLVA